MLVFKCMSLETGLENWLGETLCYSSIAQKIYSTIIRKFFQVIPTSALKLFNQFCIFQQSFCRIYIYILKCVYNTFEGHSDLQNRITKIEDYEFLINSSWITFCCQIATYIFPNKRQCPWSFFNDVGKLFFRIFARVCGHYNVLTM